MCVHECVSVWVHVYVHVSVVVCMFVWVYMVLCVDEHDCRIVCICVCVVAVMCVEQGGRTHSAAVILTTLCECVSVCKTTTSVLGEHSIWHGVWSGMQP